MGGDVEDGFGLSEQQATRQPNRKNNSLKSPDGNVRATSYTKENSLHGQSPNDAHLRDQGHAVVPDYMHNDSSMYLSARLLTRGCSHVCFSFLLGFYIDSLIRVRKDLL